jgi:Fe-S-cluster-containing dehydrogenase component
MSRYGMVIDTRKCVGCMDCVVACQTENDVPAGYCRDWITTEVRGEFPHVGLEIRSERCVSACPYDARYVHPEGYVDKCTFCHHRTKEGIDPACVAVCPTRCMTFGDLDDPASKASVLLRTRKSHALLPEAGTGPRVFYLT